VEFDPDGEDGEFTIDPSEFYGEMPHDYHHRYQFRGNNHNNNKNRRNNNNRRGGNRNNNHNNNKRHNGKQPWMSPDDFFNEGFQNPNKHHHQSHKPHHQKQQNHNAAGVNLSSEEYEAILNMHSDGRSFTFIANALGLTEAQAIAGFNVAKKKEKGFTQQEQPQPKENENSNKNNNKNEKPEPMGKGPKGPSVKGTNLNNAEKKKTVFDVDEDATTRSTKPSGNTKTNNLVDDVFGSDDVDANDSSYEHSKQQHPKHGNNKGEEDAEEEEEDPKPFRGRPLHFHSSNRKHHHHHNNNNKHRHNNNQNRQNQKWRRR
jgi:hypothetical protein